MKNYDDIELTPEETEIAIQDAKRQKAARLRLQQYSDDLKGEKQYITYDADTYFQLILMKVESVLKMKKQPEVFKLDDWCKKFYWALALYFTNDPRFEKLNDKWSLKKGLLIMGNVGCGKTLLLSAFTNNQKMSFVSFTCESITDDYKDGGEGRMRKYYEPYKPMINQSSFGHKYHGIMFDDMGSEDAEKHFGNELTVMAKILKERHQRELASETFITTNLKADEIEKKYGTRVRSRMRQMFNVIKFDNNAPDRRK